jgi:alkylated DNA repair dioxygenase AlkB
MLRSFGRHPKVSFTPCVSRTHLTHHHPYRFSNPSTFRSNTNPSTDCNPILYLEETWNRVLRAHHHSSSITCQLQSGDYFSQASHALSVLNNTFCPAFATDPLLSDLNTCNKNHIRSQLSHIINHYLSVLDDATSTLSELNFSEFAHRTALCRVINKISSNIKLTSATTNFAFQLISKITKYARTAHPTSIPLPYPTVRDRVVGDRPVSATLGRPISLLPAPSTRSSGAPPVGPPLAPRTIPHPAPIRIPNPLVLEQGPVGLDVRHPSPIAGHPISVLPAPSTRSSCLPPAAPPLVSQSNPIPRIVPLMDIRPALHPSFQLGPTRTKISQFVRDQRSINSNLPTNSSASRLSQPKISNFVPKSHFVGQTPVSLAPNLNFAWNRNLAPDAPELKDHSFISYDTKFLPSDLQDDAVNFCQNSVPWHTRVGTRGRIEPRQVAFYGPSTYSYSGSEVVSAGTSIPHPLSHIKDLVESSTGMRFNSILLNRYASGHDSIGFHADDEVELGINPDIATLSLGSVRTFLVKSKPDVPEDILPGGPFFGSIDLVPGSLFTMCGGTQQHFLHSIPKSASAGIRFSLTFRFIQPATTIHPTIDPILSEPVAVVPPSPAAYAVPAVVSSSNNSWSTIPSTGGSPTSSFHHPSDFPPLPEASNQDASLLTSLPSFVTPPPPSRVVDSSPTLLDNSHLVQPTVSTPTSNPIPLSNAVPVNIFTKHGISTNHWSLPNLSKNTAIIGDSNLARISTCPENCQILSYSGANFDRIRKLVTDYDNSHPAPKNIIISVGINNRNQNPTASSVPSLKRLIANLNSKFPSTNIFMVSINFSSLLSATEKSNLRRLNQAIPTLKNCKIIPPISAPVFGVLPSDPIHWSRSTANLMLSHWLKSLNQ